MQRSKQQQQQLSNQTANQSTRHNHKHHATVSSPDAPAAPAHEVEFVLECFGAQEVCICGDFNHWQPPGLPMIGLAAAGHWERRITLPAGRHEYKFVVDGKWQHDPAARENVRNAYGSLNSVLEVRP